MTEDVLYLGAGLLCLILGATGGVYIKELKIPLKSKVIRFLFMVFGLIIMLLPLNSRFNLYERIFNDSKQTLVDKAIPLLKKTSDIKPINGKNSEGHSKHISPEEFNKIVNTYLFHLASNNENGLIKAWKFIGKSFRNELSNKGINVKESESFSIYKSYNSTNKIKYSVVNIDEIKEIFTIRKITEGTSEDILIYKIAKVNTQNNIYNGYEVKKILKGNTIDFSSYFANTKNNMQLPVAVLVNEKPIVNIYDSKPKSINKKINPVSKKITNKRINSPSVTYITKGDNGFFTLQLAAIKNQTRAENRSLDWFLKRNIPSFIEEIKTIDKENPITLYRIYIGKFSSQKEAEVERIKLQSHFKNDPQIKESTLPIVRI